MKDLTHKIGYSLQAMMLIALATTVLNGSALDRPRLSQLELSLWNREAFEVWIGGEHFKSQGNRLTATIKAGTHRMRVLQRGDHRTDRGDREVVVAYDGLIRIPESSRLNVIIDRDGRMTIRDIHTIPGIESVPRKPGLKPKPAEGGRQCLVSEPNHSEHSLCHHLHSSHSIGPCGTPLYGENHLIGDREFSSILETVSDIWYDGDRLLVAQQAISDRKLSSQQVLSLLTAFNFEESKLAFAKFAYGRVTDRERYYIVNEQFSFSSSIRELNEYMETQG